MKVLFYGVGSYKNRGVEAIVNSSLKQFNNHDVTIACYDYENNKNKYSDKVKYINHYISEDELTSEDKKKINNLSSNNAPYKKIEEIHQKEVINKIKDYDICISSGGDNYCYGDNHWLYAIDEAVKENNKKLVLWGASLYDEMTDGSLINNLSKFDVLVLRESISYNAISKYINKDKLLLIPDPAFSLDKEEIELDKFYNDNKVVGINVSPLTIPEANKDNYRYKAIIDLIDYILNETTYGISLIPHVTTDKCSDLEILNKIYEEYKDNKRVYLEKDTYNCNQIKYIISNCEMLVAARTHASIAAYSTCVPTLVIGYSVKSRGLANDLFGDIDQYVIPCDKLYSDILLDKFKYLDSNKDKIKKHLEKVTPDMIKSASTIFEQVLNKLEENEKYSICDHNKCIGCGLCKKNCPKDAIIESIDDLGFKCYEIDKKKCINCGLCKKNCPVNNKKLNPELITCYAAYSKNEDDRKGSASGGIMPLIARKALPKYVIYGANLCGTVVKHIRIDDIKDIDKIRGSKYLQSSIFEVFDLIKKDIKDNKKIIFTGTPCQIGAIKSLANDYKDIIYISVICHGVMSPVILDQYLKENKIKVNDNTITFKVKDNGWSTSSIKLIKDNKAIIEKFNDNSMMGLYIKNITLRESCYNCQFKGNYNQADIVLGDYWGVDTVHPELFDNRGCSCIITNTKGDKFIKSLNILDECEYTLSDINHVYRYNSSFIYSPIVPDRRYTIINDIKNNTLELINKCESLANSSDNSVAVSGLNNEIDNLKKEIDNLNKEIVNLNKTIEEYNKIFNSRRWHMYNKLFRGKNK